MNTTPIFSIIIPVYNVAQYLRDCLDSVLTGQGDGYEVIAINDCSLDGSLAILREFEKSYPCLKVISFEQNQGVSAARNAGIEAAQGEWLMFCDSDDVLIPGAIPLLRKKIAAVECELVTFELQRVSSVHDNVALKADFETCLHDMGNELDASGFVCKNFPHRLWAWNKCFKRSLIGDLRFRNYQPCEDAVFSLDCMLRAKHVLEVPEILYKYVQHEGSCLKTVNTKRVNGDINGMVDLCETALDWEYAKTIRKHVCHQLRDCFFRGCIRNLRTLKTSSPDDMSALEKSFFDGVEKVFVKSSLTPLWTKMGYGLVTYSRSLTLAATHCKCADRVRAILSLLRRLARRNFHKGIAV